MTQLRVFNLLSFISFFGLLPFNCAVAGEASNVKNVGNREIERVANISCDFEEYTIFLDHNSRTHPFDPWYEGSSFFFPDGAKSFFYRKEYSNGTVESPMVARIIAMSDINMKFKIETLEGFMVFELSNSLVNEKPALTLYTQESINSTGIKTAQCSYETIK